MSLVVSPRLIVFWLLTGLLIVPIWLHPSTPDDFLIRLPIIVLVMLDAGLSLQFALIYTFRLRPETLPPQLARMAPGIPAVWLCVLGYYGIALYAVFRIILAAHGPVPTDAAVLFGISCIAIAFWKFRLCRAIGAMTVAVGR